MPNLSTKAKLGKGNTKLGTKFIRTWSIPAGSTCPGLTTACANVCYAAKGFFLMPSVKNLYERNLHLSKQTSFVADITEEIQRTNTKLVRIHVSGDFYDAAYAKKWKRIIENCPSTIFYAYTRSWRIRPISTVLSSMSRLPNLRLWLSCDQETGQPSVFNRRVRTAYMQLDNADIPSYKPDLFFRVKTKTIVKKINNSIVCPPENGITETTCEKCSICWKTSRETTSIPGRLALDLIN